jgi:pimeloyl-ACP methyl ester carboxylesterase
MSHSLRWVERVTGLLAVLGFVAILLPGAASAAPVGATGQVSCQSYSGIPVALSTGEPQSYAVTGELCATRSELVAGKTVQLLIHGATYNHSYWDFGTVDRVSYSYARDLAAVGYPTFSLDEIGVGQSSHPPSADVDIQVAAFVAHQVVQDLLGGTIGKVRFGRVIEVGHSFGSITTWIEASTYHDVAGAIITGLVHGTTVFALNSTGDIYPAIDDPRFAGSGLDPGYLTSVPGTRASLFYNTADSDPNVIAQDEATKDVISATEFGSGLAVLGSTVSEGIEVPVLAIIGSQDKINCGLQSSGATFDCSSGQNVAGEEAPFYSSAAQLRACVVPNAGHDLNLELNHDLEEADAIAWSYEYIGQQGIPPIAARALPPDCST